MSNHEAHNGNGNGADPLDDDDRPSHRVIPLPLQVTEREALRGYGTMTLGYQNFVDHELPRLKRDIDVTKGAAIAAAGHAETAILETRRNALVSAEALGAAKAAEVCARASEQASLRTEGLVRNLARSLVLGIAQKTHDGATTEASERETPTEGLPPMRDREGSWNEIDAKFEQARIVTHDRVKDPGDRMTTQRARAIADEAVEAAQLGADAAKWRRVKSWPAKVAIWLAAKGAEHAISLVVGGGLVLLWHLLSKH